MIEAGAPVEVFYCYAHSDEKWLRKLETHLSLLRRQGLVSLWHNRLIAPGTDWAQAIDTHLETASVILLLVSADFLASDYCYGVEMQRALERHAAGEASVVPILVRPVDWTGAPFAHLQALPTDAKPIAAWRSKERALADVAAGIRRVIEDVPLLAASAPRAALPSIWNLPYPRNSFFIGREETISQLRSQLQAGQAIALSQPQAISGLGGIGKTQLAVEYTYRYHQDYQAVLWARADSLETLTSSYVAIANLLKLAEKDAQDQTVIVQAVKMWLQRHNRWLLILDNADELGLVPMFLPPILRGHLLLTTRASALGRLASRIEVEAFSSEQGALFLLRRACLIPADASLERASASDRGLALQIAQELGGLPLALDQAGAYLEETSFGLLEYYQIYQQRRTDLLKERRGLIADHPEPVATPWSLSFERVQQKSPIAADLLKLCAYLSPDAIAEEIIVQGASHLGPLLELIATNAFLLGQAVEALRAYSLIGRDSRTKTLSIHRLVQSVLRDNVPPEMVKQWIERVVYAVDNVFISVAPTPWPMNPVLAEDTRRPQDALAMYERYLPHALICIGWIEQTKIITPIAVHLLNKAGHCLAYFAQYTQAESLYQQALAIQQQLRTEHPDIAVCYNNLASLYTRQGKYADAEPLLQQALAIRQKQLGPEHPDTTRSLEYLAWLYERQGRYAEAEPLLQQVLAIRQQQLGSEHLDTVISLINLAASYGKRGKYGQAEPLLRQALAIQEEMLGAEHPDITTTLNNLALLYIGQGEYAQAEALLERALTISESQFGPKHHYMVVGLEIMASLYEKQGRFVEAESLYQQALAIRQQQLGAQHAYTVRSLNNLAAFYKRRNQYTEAAAYYTQAISCIPSQANAYLSRGYIYLYLRERELAYADFVRYASFNASNVNAAWMSIYTALSNQRPGVEIAERLEAIATLDPQCDEAYVCRGVALGLRGKLQEELSELEQALQLDPENEDAMFWKGMICAYLGRSTLAIELIEQALQSDLPPVLLTPIYWLKQDRPHFYQEYAESLLKQFELE